MPTSIVHYYFGPHRSGGLNRYATDLAEAQVSAGKKVAILYPGGTLFPRQKPRIITKKKYHSINLYELQGGPTVSLLEGVRNVNELLKRQEHLLSKESIQSFFDETRPDILHIHTWMGFPDELLFYIKEKGCRIVFTTHDYYGICPKVNLVGKDGNICTNPNNEVCSKCNADASSAIYLRIRNWSFLHRIKKILYPLRKASSCIMETRKSKEHIAYQNYKELQNYYRILLNTCDIIHFNSMISRQVFLNFFPELNDKSRIVSITHAGILDKRRFREIKGGLIRLCFLGSTAPYKGLPILLKVLEEIWNEGIRNWNLDIWGTEGQNNDEKKDIPIIYHGRYSTSKLEEILQDIDLVIVPSVWFETFGFVVLEAFSFGIPILCSDTVGAQSLLLRSMIYHGKEELKNKLISFLKAPVELENERKEICQNGLPPQTMKEHETIIAEWIYKKNAPQNSTVKN